MTNAYFASRKSSSPKENPTLRNAVLIILIVAVIVLCGIYSTHVIRNTMVFKPEKVYEEAFDTPISSIDNLTGDSKQTGLYDVWIRFKCAGGAKLKEESQFECKRPSQGLYWFEDKYPQDKGLATQTHLSLLWRCTSAVAKVKNQWLLHDPATATYYYREWGYK